MPAADPRAILRAYPLVMDWLEQHPEIPIDYIDYVDECEAAIYVGTGQFDVLTGLAEFAFAVDDPIVDVTENGRKRQVHVKVSGTIPAEDEPFKVTAEGCVFGDARDELITSLSVPRLPDAPAWDITAQHLRAVADRGTGNAG